MEPWFTTKPVGVGTGLGLTIAHTLAVRNGGDLRHRADAPFTTFELDLPLAVAPVAP
jgi:signal transduction histidine kinase